MPWEVPRSCLRPPLPTTNPFSIFIMKFSILALIGGIVTSSFAHPASPTHVVHEKREAQLDKWTKRNVKLNRDAIVPLSIGLTQRNLGKLAPHFLLAPWS
jgi:hypothetical protein